MKSGLAPLIWCASISGMAQYQPGTWYSAPTMVEINSGRNTSRGHRIQRHTGNGMRFLRVLYRTNYNNFFFVDPVPYPGTGTWYRYQVLGTVPGTAVLR